MPTAKSELSSTDHPAPAHLMTRLITLYQQLHDTVHARSGQASPLRLVYIRTENEACLAWVCVTVSGQRLFDPTRPGLMRV